MPSSLLLDRRQAPIAPARSPKREILISVSWLTRLSEYLRIALLIGRLMYSPASESVPPNMTNSGLKRFISPAMPFPKLNPICSSISMQSTSSFRTASSRSPSEISFPLSNLPARIVLLPSRCRSVKIRWKAEPDASVSRQPFCRNGTTPRCRTCRSARTLLKIRTCRNRDFRLQ